MLRSKLIAAAKPALFGAGLTTTAVVACTSHFYKPYQHLSSQSPFNPVISPPSSFPLFNNSRHFTLASTPDQDPSLSQYQPTQHSVYIPETELERKQREKGEREAANAPRPTITPYQRTTSTGPTPAQKAGQRLIDDGLQQIEVPVRVFPDWQPISLDRAREQGVFGFIRYPLEHIADFVRNRIDDIGYMATGEIQEQLMDMTRYEQSYAEKRAELRFNTYYEAIYRGLYDNHDIRMKLHGCLPRFDYSLWLTRVQPRPKVYLDVVLNTTETPTASVENPVIPRRIVVQLYYDILPKSTENFIGLADGFIDNDRFLSFNHTLVHRVDKGHAFFAGDILQRNGTAGMPFLATSGKFLGDEKFTLPHDGPGCLVMDNNGPNTNTSHFFISQRAMPELTGKYMVIGHVVEGMDVVKDIDRVPIDINGVPQFPIHIVESGILIEDPLKDDAFHLFKQDVRELKDRQAVPTPPPQPCTKLF